MGKRVFLGYWRVGGRIRIIRVGLGFCVTRIRGFEEVEFGLAFRRVLGVCIYFFL